MWEIIQKSGVVVYPILALSILSLAIFIERLYTLRIKNYISKGFIERLYALIKADNFSDAEKLCKEENSAMGRIADEILENKSLPWEQLVSVTEESGKREVDRLNRFQDAMSTIVALAPLLGLLGTILGMIKIFNVLSSGGVGDAQALSAGIAEALLTTAEGLCVAIPAQVFYYIMKYRSDNIAGELEKQSSKLVNLAVGGINAISQK